MLPIVISSFIFILDYDYFLKVLVVGHLPTRNILRYFHV